MRLERGRRIDRYEVEDELGQGGMAVVYRVRHVDLDTIHALKVINTDDDELRERLLREGRAQGRIRHPAVLAVTDLVDVDGSPGLVLEFVDGGTTLADLLRRGAPPIDEARRLGRALIEGVLAPWGATYELSWRRGAPAVINVPRINVAIAEAATALIGADHIDVISLPSMGAEDFSHFLAHAPGAMFRLGTARVDEPQHLLHTPLFNPDERAITLGARILARAAVALMGR